MNTPVRRLRFLACLCAAAMLAAWPASFANAQTGGDGARAAATGLAADKRQAHKDISAAEAAKMISENKGVVVLDVRTPREVRRGRIAGARHINFYDADFVQRIARLDKETAYIVYCAVGGRSADASRKMSELGFKSVHNLEGGINAWQKAGRKIE